MTTVSRRLRYEILRRDGYACHYCGDKAPDVKLTVDAIVPEALGGSHKDPTNLITACEVCNGGKSSSAPDAPLVANVAEDALRWSQAIAVAAEEMLSRASRDGDAHERFKEIWANYGYGSDRTAVPKDPAWRQTVTSLLEAGLPMAILEECVRVAMSQRKVAHDDVFRYMCGVAWRRVRELQARAADLARGAPEGRGNLDDEEIRAEHAREEARDEAVQDWCRTILRQRDPADVEMAANDCRGYADDEEPSGILWFIIHNLELDRASLIDTLRDLVEALPGGVGTRLVREHEAYWRQARTPYRPSGAITTAAQRATEHVLIDRARREMAMMPRAEYEAWVQRARDDNAEWAEHVSESFYVLDGARMAREALGPAGEEAQEWPASAA